MNPYPFFHRHIARAAGATAMTLMMLSAHAQQHAHTHGRLDLSVAVDARIITLRMDSPLDNFLGFEHMPRTDAEREQVAEMITRLDDVEGLFRPDPRGGCTLSKVELYSAVLRHSADDEQDRDDEHGHDDDHDHDHHDHHDHDHADIEMTAVFSCSAAAVARFVDIGLFDAFRNIRAIDVQAATPQGQFKRSLKPGESRVEWGG